MGNVTMERTAERVARQILTLKPGEDLALITDTARPRSITDALAHACRAAGATVVVVTMDPQAIGGEEPPPAVAAAMLASTAIINQATQSLTHTEATRRALANGARVCNLRNMTEEMMVTGGVTADYETVRETSERLAELLTHAREVRLTTPEGTDLRMSIEGRPGFAQTGFANRPGDFSGLPDGEATCAPIEGSTEGVVVSPYIVDHLGLITEPFSFSVKGGLIRDVSGGKEAKALLDLMAERGVNADRIASQFALGTNPECRIIANTREVSKKLGTAHIAVGDNRTLGGQIESRMHIDLVFLRPRVVIDGTLVVTDGELLV
jgi:leucyl aminopeptidase (aminopeptidase T)